MKGVTLMSETNFDSMVFYASWYKAADDLGEEFRNKMINQLLRYGLFGDVPDNSNDIVADMMFKMAKPNVDSNIKKKIDGRKGGRKPGNKDKDKKPETSGLSNANGNGNANANANGNVNGNALPSSDHPPYGGTGGDTLSEADEWRQY